MDEVKCSPGGLASGGGAEATLVMADRPLAPARLPGDQGKPYDVRWAQARPPTRRAGAEPRSMDPSMNLFSQLPQLHGGEDGLGPVLHDFSTNANPMGPSPVVLEAVQKASVERYPDPNYSGLRLELARFHQIDPDRIDPCSGVSEGIRRLTLAWHVLHGQRGIVLVPRPGYIDYKASAVSLGMRWQPHGGDLPTLEVVRQLPDDCKPLVWLCEPCNPTGTAHATAFMEELVEEVHRRGGMVALDRAYEPLRLTGGPTVTPAMADRVWQLWSPNKAAGMTGGRGGYGIAPREFSEDMIKLRHRMRQLSPSWVLGADGVAMLHAAITPEHQAWLAESLEQVRKWAKGQRESLQSWGWTCWEGVTPFILAQPMNSRMDVQAWLSDLRAQGIRVRDASNMGLPGWIRLGVRPPQTFHALARAWVRRYESGAVIK